ncbi:hypothetical protein JHK82_042038 [Glycine max]|nr:hypothetical protein JHK86_042091 [Glycine max]KAG4956331.1 hypothetical protein JHK85_042711 [Glycine max]KAG5105068.1 hypothetical protein JHK82_042038 [Glycine max]KAG5116193.1 hypothetical protein JHK84_042306 [Glycine max]
MKSLLNPKFSALSPKASPFALFSLPSQSTTRFSFRSNPRRIPNRLLRLNPPPFSSNNFICAIQNRSLQTEPSPPPSGEIHVIVGPMFAGKTTSLLRRIQSETANGSVVCHGPWLDAFTVIGASCLQLLIPKVIIVLCFDLERLFLCNAIFTGQILSTLRNAYSGNSIRGGGFRLFSKISEDFKPNYVTFLTVLVGERHRCWILCCLGNAYASSGFWDNVKEVRATKEPGHSRIAGPHPLGMSLISPQALECCLGPELKVLWWVLNTYNVSLTCLLGSEHKVLWWVLNSYTALKNVAIIKSSKDTRYGLDSIVTHDGAKLPCWALANLSSFKQKFGMDAYEKLDVIGIDEAQFFDDLYEFCRQAADHDGKTVIVAGLDGNYLRRSFGSVLDIIPLADSVTKLTARCEICGKRACFTLRKTQDKQIELIGGVDVYMPVCRQHYASGQVAMEATRHVLESKKVECGSHT